MMGIDLCENDIGDAGACALADALKVNTTLMLYLNDYEFYSLGDIGARALNELCKRIRLI